MNKIQIKKVITTSLYSAKSIDIRCQYTTGKLIVKSGEKNKALVNLVSAFQVLLLNKMMQFFNNLAINC